MELLKYEWSFVNNCWWFVRSFYKERLNIFLSEIPDLSQWKKKNLVQRKDYDLLVFYHGKSIRHVGLSIGYNVLHGSRVGCCVEQLTKFNLKFSKVEIYEYCQ